MKDVLRKSLYILNGLLITSLVVTVVLVLITLVNSSSSNNNGEILGEESSIYGNEDFSGEYVEGEVLVKYRDEKIDLDTVSGRSSADRLAADVALEKKEHLINTNISVFEIKDEKSVEEKIEELLTDPNVEYAEPNYVRYSANIDTNDTHKNLLWGLHNSGQSVNGTSGTVNADIDAPEAWDLYFENGEQEEIIVAIIDDGVAYNHPDLVNMMWDGSECKDENGNFLGGCNHGYDFIDNDKDPLPNDSHGTHIAGIIGAERDNSIGVLGVAPNVKIMALRVGTVAFSLQSIIKAIDFAIENGAHIINASYGGNGFSSSEQNAIIRFRDSGGIFVAAAGNDASNNNSTPFYPASYNLNNIISVAATNQFDNLASFSNYGSSSVHVGAPGTNIYSSRLFTLFDENFNSIMPGNLGDSFTQSGDNSWGVVIRGDRFKGVMVSDYSNWESYRNNIESNLDTIPVDIEGRDNSYLGFYIQCDTVEGDGVELYFMNGSTSDYLGTYSGNVSSNEQIPIPSEYATDNFQVRFKWITGDGEVGEDNRPCFIDDVRIIDGASGSETGMYMYAQGTSMAAPYVSGLAALIWGYDSSFTYSEVRDLILNTGDSLSSLSDKTITGKRVNAYNALSELEEEPEPEPQPDPETEPEPEPEVPPSPPPNPDDFLVPVYRFWSDLLGGHFFTASRAERDMVLRTWPNVWSYEGTAYRVHTRQIDNTTPVYRFWSTPLASHFYTNSRAERDMVLRTWPNIWSYEGIAYYVYTSQVTGSKPVYRFWSDHLQSHFYTSDINERNFIIANYPSYIWRSEGIAFYVK